MNSAPPVQVPVPRRKRPLRLLFTIVVLLLLLVALAPYALIGTARTWFGERLTGDFGTPCRIDRLRFGWFSGFELAGLEIGNAPGFDQAHPLLRIGSARADVSLLRLLRGRLDLVASAHDLQIWIDQDQNGLTNLERLLAAADVDIDGPPARSRSRRATSGDGGWMGGMRLDLELRRGNVEIRRAGQLLEMVSGLECRVTKEPDNGSFIAVLDAVLPATRPEGKAGAVHVHAQVDGGTHAVDGQLRANRLDLSRYQPLVRACFGPDALSVMAGVIDGVVEFRSDPAGRVAASGDLTVAAPHFAGTWLSGVELRAERWTLRPGLALTRTQDGTLVAADSAATHVDLGLLRVDGLDAAARRAAGIGDDAVALGFQLDLDALAAGAGRMSGTASLPLAMFQQGAAPLLAMLRDLRGITVNARVDGSRWSGHGLQLAGGTATFALVDGVMSLRTDSSTTLNAAPLQLTFSADARAPQVPFDLTLAWQGGKVAGECAPWLRHAVPLLAGLGGRATDFASTVDLRLWLRGPTARAADQTWLQWIDTFEGQSDLTLRNGFVQPSPALAGLLQLLGQQSHLAIDELTGKFTKRPGAIATKATRWVSKGREYALTGSARLDGALDFGLDVTSLLKDHADGRVVAAFLGDKPLLANLKGTVAAPSLALPDLGRLVQQAVRQAPRDVWEQRGQELLQRELDRLLRDRKK